MHFGMVADNNENTKQSGFSSVLCVQNLEKRFLFTCKLARNYAVEFNHEIRSIFAALVFDAIMFCNNVKLSGPKCNSVQKKSTHKLC